jgi:hypothetical protein
MTQQGRQDPREHTPVQHPAVEATDARMPNFPARGGPMREWQ